MGLTGSDGTAFQEAALSAEALAGYTVGVTAQRRGDDQAVMWRRLGAQVLQGPAIVSVPVADSEALRCAVNGVIAVPPAWLVANTGYGIRALLAMVESWGLGKDFRLALATTRVVARGPKAAGAVRSAGIELEWRSPSEQLSEVAGYLLRAGVRGATVAFQHHGDDAPGCIEALEAEGAHVIGLSIYHWVRADSDAPAVALIEACCGGKVDALTFTSAPGVRNFMAVAEEVGMAEPLLEAANTSMVVGCVGPVCAEAASTEGFDRIVVPEQWRLGSLVKVVAAALVTAR